MAKNKTTIHLACEVCRERNYTHIVAKSRTTGGALRVSKFCSRCRKHNIHKETK